MDRRLVARVQLAEYETAEATDNTIAYLKKAGFNEVMVMNCRGHCEPAHYPREQILERARLMGAAMKRFSTAGFKVTLNNLATVGMNLSPPSTHDFGIQPLVDPDGQIFSECFCPADERFHEYLHFLFSTWASLGPAEIWIDDDFRYKNKAAHCFCPLHLGKLKEETGYDWSRESLGHALRESKNHRLASQWSNIQKQALFASASAIADAVHEVDPSIRIGLMGVLISVHHYGRDYLAELLRIFNPGGQALVRPEFAAYSDLERLNWSAYRPLWACRLAFGDDYEALPEFEIFPGTRFNHSNRVLRMKYLWAAAYGFAHSAESVMWGTHIWEPEFEAVQAKNFEISSRVLEVCTDVGYQPEGVNLMLTQDKAGTSDMPDVLTLDSLAANAIGRLGIPLWPGGNHANILTGNATLSTTESQWREWVKSGVILDRSAFDALVAAGRSGWVEGAVNMAMPGIPGWERFADDARNGIASSGMLSMELATVRRADMQAFQLPANNKSITVSSWFEDEDGNELSPACWLIEKPEGRVVVLPFAFDDGTSWPTLANWKRKSQLEELLQWAAAKPLPVRTTGAADLFCLYRRRDDNRSVLLALANFSNDPTERLGLHIPLAATWHKWRLHLLEEDGDWQCLTSGEGAKVTMGIPIVDSMSVAVVCMEAI